MTAELHAMAMRASAAYRAARGLPALDADLRVPAAQLLAYHQDALAILAAAGLSPDAKREYDVFLRPPRLAIAVLPAVWTRCGLPADQCEQLFLAAVAQEQQPSSSVLRDMQSDLGHRFLAERRHDKAMEWYQRAIQTGGMERLTFGQRVDVYRCAAVAAQSAGASALRKEYGEVVWGGSPAETNDTHAMAWYTAGRACQEQREADAALFCYQLARRSAADKNGWASASYHAAKLLEQAERAEEAAVLWKEIINELPREKIMLYMEWEPGRSSGYPDKMLEEQGRRFMAAFRSGQILQRFQLEAASAQGVTGVVRRVNSYKVRPAPVPGAQRPREIVSLPPVDPRLAQALTNLVALADSASWSATSGWVNLPYAKRDAMAAQLTKEFGHDVVPAILTMVLDTSRNHYKPQLGGEANMTPWAVEAMLDRAVTKEDAPFLLAACTNHYWLMKMAARLDPEGTTEVVRQAWMANLEQPLFVRELFAARLQALYPLVLAYVSVKGKNHHVPIFELARVVDAEKDNAELQAAFREALGDCLSRMWRASDTYELARISQIALRQGVPEVIALLADSLPAAQCLAQVRPYMDLPVNNDEALEMLLANRCNWQWDFDRKRFRLPASGDAAK